MNLLRIAIAVTRMKEMRNFYNQVFQANLQPMETEAGTFYHGQLANLALTFVPNILAKVVAEQNRQQLSFLVDDLDKVLKTVEAAGGKRIGQLIESPEGRQGAVTDPDGNTIEFFQQSAKA